MKKNIQKSKEKQSIVVMQCAGRSFIARKRVRTLLKRHIFIYRTTEAAIKIQRNLIPKLKKEVARKRAESEAQMVAQIDHDIRAMSAEVTNMAMEPLQMHLILDLIVQLDKDMVIENLSNLAKFEVQMEKELELMEVALDNTANKESENARLLLEQVAILQAEEAERARLEAIRLELLRQANEERKERGWMADEEEHTRAAEAYAIELYLASEERREEVRKQQEKQQMEKNLRLMAKEDDLAQKIRHEMNVDLVTRDIMNEALLKVEVMVNIDFIFDTLRKARSLRYAAEYVDAESAIILASNTPDITPYLEMKVHLEFGELYLATANFTKSKVEFEDALARCIVLFGKTHLKCCQIIFRIGEWHRLQADYKVALKHYEKALSLCICDQSPRATITFSKHLITHIEITLSVGNHHYELGDYASFQSVLEKLKPYFLTHHQNNHLIIACGTGCIVAEYLMLEGFMLKIQGDYKASITRFKEAMDRYKQSQPNMPIKQAVCADELGRLALIRCELESAKKLISKAFDIRQLIFFSNKLHPNVADSLFSRAHLSMQCGNLAEAYSLFTQSLEMRKSLFADGPNGPYIHPCIAQSLLGISEYTRIMGFPKTAQRDYMIVKTSLKDAGLFDWQTDCTEVLFHLAQNAQLLGDFNKAFEYLNQAIEQREKLRIFFKLGVYPALEICKLKMGSLCSAMCRFTEASELINITGKILSKTFGENHSAIIEGLHVIGELSKSRGKYSTAEKVFARCLAQQVSLTGENHYLANMYLLSSSENLRMTGYYQDCVEFCNQSLESRIQMFGESSLHVGLALYNRAQVVRDLGHIDDAEPLYRQSIANIEENAGKESFHYAAVLGDLGECHRLQEKFDEARIILLQSLELRKRFFGENHILVAETMCSLGILLYDTGKAKDAELMFREEVIPYAESIVGDEHPITMYCKGIRGLCLKAMLYDDGTTANANSTVSSENENKGVEEYTAEGAPIVLEALKFFDQYEDSPFAEDHPWVLKLGGFGNEETVDKP